MGMGLSAHIQQPAQIRIGGKDGGRVFVQDTLGDGNPGDDQEEQHHGQANGNGCIPQEGEALGEINVLSGVVLILGEQLGALGGEPVAQTAEMTQPQIVGLDDLLHGRSAVSGGSSGDEGQQTSAGDPER